MLPEGSGYSVTWLLPPAPTCCWLRGRACGRRGVPATRSAVHRPGPRWRRYGRDQRFGCLTPQRAQKSLHDRVLLVAECSGRDLGEAADDSLRRDLRLGRQPVLDRRQMRIELRRHAHAGLVFALRTSMRSAHFAASTGRRAERAREGKRVSRLRFRRRWRQPALGDPITQFLLCRTYFCKQQHRIEAAIRLAQAPLDCDRELWMCERAETGCECWNRTTSPF
jgi:hypothetical protein